MKKLALACALGGLATQALGQLVVGNDQTGSTSLWLIDVNTGVATPLFTSTTTNTKPWGMAADNVNGILYWNNGGTLYSATFADLLSGTPTINSVTMTHNAGAVNYVGLGYNPTTGKLLGTRNITTEGVYEIDPVTGVGILLYAYSTTFDFGGLDYDPATAKLFGLSDTPTTARGLYELIDATTINLIIPGYPGTETDIDGLAVGNGRAYYVTDGPISAQPNFYVYDIASGQQVGTLPSPFTGTGTFSAAAWAPGLMNTQATVSGSIDLEDYIPDEAGRSVTFDVIQGGNVIDTEIVALSLNGAYSFTTSASGVCEVAAKSSHWLRKKSAPVNINPGGTTNVDLSLSNGDINDDNEIDIGDYSLLSIAFGSTPVDPNWNAEADLNGDDEVDIGDFAILSNNFGMVGD
ncbi:MAG TPA: dockerin type I domain-containing protein [Fimbriimonadaceae bacterium]|nr:dockerin type I domain-containing protein [Fimbriimonadaceae bacterium]HRJ96737.1 dockerin type I domain-containing protein [Fimbriimonadaceae bacterium]